MSDTQRTNEELADALKQLNDNQEEFYGPRFPDIDEAARRLREPEGERIEGWARGDQFKYAAECQHEARTAMVDFSTFKLLASDKLEVPATLILKPQEPTDD